MGDILKNLGGGWAYVASWVAPAIAFWSVFALFFFPPLAHLPLFEDIAGISAGEKALVLAGVALISGLLLNALSTVMYRVLEGYYLGQGRLWNQLRKRHTAKRAALQRRLDDAGRTGSDRIQVGLLRERLRRYPADPEEIGPTAFSNAIRAIETYGWNRFRLDSQTFWSELVAVAPEGLREEEEAARTPINFFVSLVFLSLLSTMTAVVLVVTVDAGPGTLFAGLIALALAPVCYRLAVLNTRYLDSVVQALVNLGRVGLAKQYGLALPAKLDEERDMWERLFWFTYQPYDEAYIDDLTPYRADLRKGEDAAS